MLKQTCSLGSAVVEQLLGELRLSPIVEWAENGATTMRSIDAFFNGLEGRKNNLDVWPLLGGLIVHDLLAAWCSEIW